MLQTEEVNHVKLVSLQSIDEHCCLSRKQGVSSEEDTEVTGPCINSRVQQFALYFKLLTSYSLSCVSPLTMECIGLFPRPQDISFELCVYGQYSCVTCMPQDSMEDSGCLKLSLLNCPSCWRSGLGVCLVQHHPFSGRCTASCGARLQLHRVFVCGAHSENRPLCCG